jgi:predicted ABC-type ATPase
MPAKPYCLIIAGPDGAGKTTFARQFLPADTKVLNFINADNIASGLALDPQLAAVAAGRIFLAEIDRIMTTRVNFAFETTLSGVGHLTRIRKMQAAGYEVGRVFLKLDSPQLALRRVESRTRQGGHSVPRVDILRRFKRGWSNFTRIYKFAVDRWSVYNNSGNVPILLESDR